MSFSPFPRAPPTRDCYTQTSSYSNSFFIVMFAFHHSSSSPSPSGWLFMYDFTYERRETEVTLFRRMLGANTVAILCVTRLRRPHRRVKRVWYVKWFFSFSLPAANHTTLYNSLLIWTKWRPFTYTSRLVECRRSALRINIQKFIRDILSLWERHQRCHFRLLTTFYHVIWDQNAHSIASTSRPDDSSWSFILSEPRYVQPEIKTEAKNGRDGVQWPIEIEKSSWIERGHILLYYKTILYEFRSWGECAEWDFRNIETLARVEQFLSPLFEVIRSPGAWM